MKTTNQLSLFTQETLPYTKTRTVEYFVVISPDEQVKSEVSRFKYRMNFDGGISKSDLHSIAHISFIKIHTETECDNAIRSIMDNTFGGEKAFTVYTRGFNVSSNGSQLETLYLTVKNQPDVTGLQQKLFDVLKFSPPTSPIPHITIARKINKHAFAKTKERFMGMNYSAAFLCERITVLKRFVYGAINGKYEVFHETVLQK